MNAEKIIITKDKYRLINEKFISENKPNVLFLPGGLGFGSEYFLPVINNLNSVANLWRLDFPDDGSNRFNEAIDFDNTWRPGLIEAVKALDNVVLITHSVSAMLALTIPELDKILKGFVIIASAPSAKWQIGLLERAKNYNLPSLEKLNYIYAQNKNDHTFKEFFLSLLPYYIKPDYLESAKKLFDALSYHYIRYEWSQNYFQINKYQAISPKETPTLILGSHSDIITPISLFKDEPDFLRSNISFFEIKNAGHFPWIEKPKSFKQSLEKFLINLC